MEHKSIISFCKTADVEYHVRDIYFRQTNARENINCGKIFKWSHLQNVDVSGKIVWNQQQLWEHLQVVSPPKCSSNSNYQGRQEGTSGLSEDNEITWMQYFLHNVYASMWFSFFWNILSTLLCFDMFSKLSRKCLFIKFIALIKPISSVSNERSM